MEGHVRFSERGSGQGPGPGPPPSLTSPPSLSSVPLSASTQTTPKGFQRGQIYYKFLLPSFLEGDFKYSIGPNQLKTPFNTSRGQGLWFATKRQLPIIGMRYKNIPGLLVVEVRLYESSKIIESTGVYKTDILHISNPKQVQEFFRGVEVATWEINPEFVLAFLPLMPNIRRFLIQKNPLNLLEFPSYTFDEAVEACKRDRDLIDDIVPEFRLQVKLALSKAQR
jgi:hypothetical protein